MSDFLRNHPFDASFYGDVNAPNGKSTETKGKIKNYKDKPEIILNGTNQLAVLGVRNLSLFLNPPAASPTNAPQAAPSTDSFPEIM